MGYIKVTAEDLDAIAATLQRTANEIDQLHTQALSSINGLVGAGWEGAASEHVSMLLSGWQAASEQSVQALQQLSEMLRNAGSAYAETEAAISQSMSDS